MTTTNSRGDVATTFKVRGKKPSDRYSVWSSCCDDLNCRGLPTSQYQIVIGVIRSGEGVNTDVVLGLDRWGGVCR